MYVNMRNNITSNLAVESIRIDVAGQELEVETMHPLELLTRLPLLALENDLTITEMRSADESLQQIFTTLMRIHRGEVRVPG